MLTNIHSFVNDRCTSKSAVSLSKLVCSSLIFVVDTEVRINLLLTSQEQGQFLSFVSKLHVEFKQQLGQSKTNVARETINHFACNFTRQLILELFHYQT